MSIELMLNGVNINLMAFSTYLDGSEIRVRFTRSSSSPSPQRKPP